MKSWIISWLFLLWLSGCQIREPNFPIEPRIEFRGFTVLKGKNGLDSLGYLKIYVEDGDGDLGLAESDTLPPFDLGSPYYYNFVVKINQKIGNSWEQVLQEYQGRFPSLNPSHEKKPIQAVITMEMDLSYWKLFLSSQEVKFDVFIYDRAMHQSNVVTTPSYKLNL